ncbi:MAG: hybrid sensor histidine kinase/response regulator [Polyangiaceae bacterium]
MSDARLAEQVSAEQLRIVVAQTPQRVTAPAALALISAFVLRNEVPHAALWPTLGLLFAVLASWLWYFRRYRQERPGAAESLVWVRRAKLHALVHGSCWGLYSVAAFPHSSSYQGLVVAFMYGLVAGATVVDGPYFAIFARFALPTLLPVVVRCFFEANAASLAIGCAGLVGLAQSSFAAFNASRVTVAAIRARLENAELLLLLRQQKEIAEAANQEKSRFLAAASHDLRQPVHALGLFTAAARRARSDDERREIVGHIESSVASLSALFDSLLEVSRIDSGSLPARIERVPLRPLFALLEAEYRDEAAHKGLRFRARTPAVTLRTDPVLLERMLRNLLSNALRYTERGGVLLACRRRGGAARVEVWDSGVGIAPEHRARVFAEFYQVDNPQRDRRRGVGLGLSIVARLSGLLEHPLGVASRVGHGSCFSLTIPLWQKTVAGSTSATPEPHDSALLGVVVAVIDDEPEILSALGLLLKQYGCVAVLAASGDLALAELQRRELGPDLVLSDFRLGGREDGLGLIRRFRSEYGPTLPAAIVSGDVPPERLREIEASGVTLLKKPVSDERLRQALLALLAQPPE